MVNTKDRLITFFVAEDGEAVYSQQKQDLELTVVSHQLQWDRQLLIMEDVEKQLWPKNVWIWVWWIKLPFLRISL